MTNPLKRASTVTHRWVCAAPKRAYSAVFQPAARYPADPRAVFILALSVFGGITALALQAAPETLEALLPRWGVVVWGVLLALGSLVTLVGMMIKNISGIIIEQVGSVTVGVTCVYYSTLAFWFLGNIALQDVGVVMAWGLACFIRWAQLQALIQQAHHTNLKAHFEDRVHEEVQRRLP